MKTERLLSIVIYLLNNDTVSAAKLAAHFEVSKRTILRDIEQISLAGIPIKSLIGANGGYSIMEGYKIDGRLISANEQGAIVTALTSLLTAYNGSRYTEALEKIASILPKQQNQHVFLDFGASGENDETQTKLKAFEEAIADKKAVRISYENASGESSNRIVEPIALNYRWHAWYLLAYCQTRLDYRVFKLVRICEYETTNVPFMLEHDEPAVLLEHAFEGNERKGMDVTLLGKADIMVQIREYLKGTITETLENGDFVMHMYVLEDERMWYAMLLSFGNQVRVLAPEALKTRLTETAEKILKLYRKR